jgi:choline dehydrogenase-like flavoprotein
MYVNTEGKKEVTYDAIVIGSGISGGFAAKELCEKGLKTLVLERGRDVKHVVDYPTASLDSWELPNGDNVPEAEVKEHYFNQSRTGYTIKESTKHFFVKDSEQPYTEVQRFDWMRGYHVGGRSIMWGRQSYRWSDLDFEANAKDGIAVDWPIRYADIAPWYDYVERYIGVSGQKEGLHQLPDGEFLPPMEFNCIEEFVKEKSEAKYPERRITIGRTAHLTQPNPEYHGTRGQCLSRNRCIRGCPYGAYYSSNAAALPAAEATGNMTLRPHSIVQNIILDEKTQKAVGVRIIDAETMEVHEFFAKVIFCCASALGTTHILLNSRYDSHPNGLGNLSGELGHNIMDHHFRAGARAKSELFGDKYFKGRRPNGIYVPRFRNIDNATKRRDFIRGYGYQGGGGRQSFGALVAEEAFLMGAQSKDQLSEPGPWSMNLLGFGETLPYHENKVELDYSRLDKWGLPVLKFDAGIKTNEKIMRLDMMNAAAEMLEAAGLKEITTYDDGYALGLGIHEMGTARMGNDPKTSILNKWNQMHQVSNVFVTDGACMTSAACVNPSLTYMALTARAVDYAVKQLKNNNL